MTTSRIEVPVPRVPLILLLCALIVAALGCSRSSVTVNSRDFTLSVPNRLSPGEQVVGFELHVRNGKITSLTKVPFDWNVTILVEAPQSIIRGTPNHGASAFQDIGPLTRFLVLQKDGANFEISGSLVTTKNFTQLKTNRLQTADFTLE